METATFEEALVLGRSHEQLWPGHDVYLVRSVSRPVLATLCSGDNCAYALLIDSSKEG